MAARVETVIKTPIFDSTRAISDYFSLEAIL